MRGITQLVEIIYRNTRIRFKGTSINQYSYPITYSAVLFTAGSHDLLKLNTPLKLLIEF